MWFEATKSDVSFIKIVFTLPQLGTVVRFTGVSLTSSVARRENLMVDGFYNLAWTWRRFFDSRGMNKGLRREFFINCCTKMNTELYDNFSSLQNWTRGMLIWPIRYNSWLIQRDSPFYHSQFWFWFGKFRYSCLAFFFRLKGSPKIPCIPYNSRHQKYKNRWKLTVRPFLRKPELKIKSSWTWV